jgi:DNA-binding beta-propeller fold protein YncE
MATRLGSGDHTYEEKAEWARLPASWGFKEVADVVVDSRDRVYVFNRGEHPMIVFEREGSFVKSWGEDLFTRPHGLTLGPDETLYCVDDGAHCVYHCTLDGEVLQTMGVPGEPAPRFSGLPFNRPTKVAIDPRTGDLYIADGYGNARVHKYSGDGRHLFSWGDYGTDRGEFNLVHSVVTDAEGRVYVADRESHRVQVFDERGKYVSQWNNLHRPCALHIAGGLAYVGQVLASLPVNADYPNLGACVSIHDLTSRRLARLGDARPGEGPGQFTAPHGLAVDSRGDIYVGEVSWSGYGKRLDPPRTVRSFRKLVKVG